MSAISDLLNNIKNAIYGEDVRDSIHDAIAQCYSDVTNPTLQTEALEAAIQEKIDAGEMATLTIGDGTITAEKLAAGVIDSTLTTPGAAAGAAATGNRITAFESNLYKKVALDSASQTAIGTSSETHDNLNTFRAPGNYRVLDATAAANVDNLPVIAPGTLRVGLIASQGTTSWQRYIAVTASGPQIYDRLTEDSGDTWTDWKRSITEDEMISASVTDECLVLAIGGSE